MDDLGRQLKESLVPSTSLPPSIEQLRHRLVVRRRRRALTVSLLSVGVLGLGTVGTLAAVRSGRDQGSAVRVFTAPTPQPTTPVTSAPPSSVPPTSTPPPVPPTFTPNGIGFWTAQRGLLVATMTTSACRSNATPCPGGLIDRTTDGGTTWSVVDRLPGNVVAVAVAGSDPNVAWVTAARCGDANPSTCPAAVLRTSDGGSTWTPMSPQAPIASVTPLSATTAFAVMTVPSGTGYLAGSSLVRTDDGGQTWRHIANPCSRVAFSGIQSVNFASPTRGWLTCAQEPGAGMQGKALFATTDGGSIWALQSECLAGATGGRLGNLPCSGYLSAMTFLADGYGWLWMGRGSLYATSDAARSWSDIAANILVPDVSDVIAATPVSDRDGTVLLRDPDKRYFALFATSDAGATWTLTQHWPLGP